MHLDYKQVKPVDKRLAIGLTVKEKNMCLKYIICLPFLDCSISDFSKPFNNKHFSVHLYIFLCQISDYLKQGNLNKKMLK